MASILIALFYWLFESSIHFYAYGETQFELVLSEFDEIWMRCVIVSLIIALGISADICKGNMLKKEREKMEIYLSMMQAT